MRRGKSRPHWTMYKSYFLVLLSRSVPEADIVIAQLHALRVAAAPL